ncbi:hypothetical protein N657DRAFT_54613 [Parathielavia appendiculata]|uniref:Uncharacterized protein n=1 Tax=Parathielavia appendiculata TaxID=2587402 RepID=A0AAN6Z8R3_9PEZI|nr:hypothetical protein N657DRAFT_54613 [Parathielavia appendiculata]
MAAGESIAVLISICRAYRSSSQAVSVTADIRPSPLPTTTGLRRPTCFLSAAPCAGTPSSSFLGEPFHSPRFSRPDALGFTQRPIRTPGLGQHHAVLAVQASPCFRVSSRHHPSSFPRRPPISRAGVCLVRAARLAQ